MNDRETLTYLAGLPEGTFVLHGSPHKLSIIEPRVPPFLDTFPELGRRGVYGTLAPRIALLYANIHEDRANWGWKADFNKSPTITVVAPDPCKGGSGYVYVLPRARFTCFFGKGLTCAAYEAIVPMWSVAVSQQCSKPCKESLRLGSNCLPDTAPFGRFFLLIH